MFLLPLPIILFLLILFVLLSFFFSASETAVIGLSRIRLRYLTSKGRKNAQRLQSLVVKPDKFITAILIGNNFVNVAISSIITSFFVYTIGYRWGVVAATFATSIFILIFCEITPKILATKHTEKIALLSSPIMEFIMNALYPAIRVFTGMANLIIGFFGLEPSGKSPVITEEEIKIMIEMGKEAGVLTDDERKMFHRIFKFGDTTVREVMMPKEQIVAVDIKASPEKFLDVCSEKGHERIPVYENSVDNIIGIIYVKDLLYILQDNKLFVPKDLVRPAHYIEPTKSVSELLKDFQGRKFQISIVVDKNKKTLGLVTLEDLVEEIIGEIDEYIKSDVPPGYPKSA